MQQIIKVIMLLLAAASACLQGCSKANTGFVKFAPSGQEFLSCSFPVGGLSIVYGNSIVNGSINRGNQQNLLYVLFLCPGVRIAESQAESQGIESDLMSSPVIYHSWETDIGNIRMDVLYDSQLRNVAIGEQKFSLQNGNVFVVVRAADGGLSAKQCGSLGPHADFPEVARHIRDQLSNDSLISSVKFGEADEKVENGSN